jgi:D-amino peptidase
MEGISGVVHWDQVTPGHPEHARFRKIMTAEVNAAARGAYEAGAETVIVTDGHAHGRNILIEELDPRARLNSGNDSEFAMVQGVDSGVDGVIFVGYHARVGVENGILEHTWSSQRVSGLWINTQPFGEIGLNAALSGHFGVPVLMISGDQTACAEAQALLGPLETVLVKQASGRFSADCMAPETAQSHIEAAAAKAVARLAQGQSPEPLRVSTPVALAVELMTSEMADRAARVPGVRRSGRRIEYTADEIPTIYRAFRVIVGMAG